jgi:hypothetical protein
MSKIAFKAQLVGDAPAFDDIALTICDQFFGGPIGIQLSSDLFFKLITADVTNWTSDCATWGNVDTPRLKATLNTGDCQIKFSYTCVNCSGGPDPGDKGTLSIKCLLSAPVASPTMSASVDFYDTSVPNAWNHGICFGNAAANPACTSPAIVKKDGSDGKSVKMSTAPVDACQNGC